MPCFNIPQQVSFNACISAAGGGGAWQLALELLRMLEQLVPGGWFDTGVKKVMMITNFMICNVGKTW